MENSAQLNNIKHSKSPFLHTETCSHFTSLVKNTRQCHECHGKGSPKPKYDFDPKNGDFQRTSELVTWNGKKVPAVAKLRTPYMARTTQQAAFIHAITTDRTAPAAKPIGPPPGMQSQSSDASGEPKIAHKGSTNFSTKYNQTALGTQTGGIRASSTLAGSISRNDTPPKPPSKTGTGDKLG